jgi:Kdo2-lipid IVA lauroyltransferase/acyltransferase
LYKLRQHIVYIVESAAIAITFAILRLMPVDWASDMAGFIGRKLGFLVKENQIGRENLRAAFPEKSAAEIESILAGAWDNLIRTFVEYSQLDRLWDKDPENPHIPHRVEFADPERFFQLRDHPQPGIVFTGHCGNWEILPVAAVRFGLPLAIVFRPPNNPLARRLVERIRSRTMGRLLPSSVMGTAAAAAGAVAQGENVGLLIDQYFGKGIDIPFFGRPARTAPTLAKLARRLECPVTGVVVERLKGARFRLHILPTIDIPRTGNAEADDRALMTAVTKALEDWVKTHPEQWLWQHRRWR